MNSKVLLVDDDHVFLHVYATILRQYFPTDAAEGATAALNLLAEEGPYAVVITDLRMPGIDGVDFLRRVNQLAPRTKKILFTGKPDLDSVLAAVNDARIFGCMGKEVPPEDLVAKVRQALREYRRDEPAPSRASVLTSEEKNFLAGGEE